MKQARVFLISALFLAGCAKNIDNKEAVQAGVRKYVSGKGINVDQMEVNVNSVSFHGKQADATVVFNPKGGGSGVSATYALERVNDEWVVKSRSPMGPVGHAEGQGQLPPGHGTTTP